MKLSRLFIVFALAVVGCGDNIISLPTSTTTTSFGEYVANYEASNALKIAESAYSGKSFMTDAISTATLSSCVDGDTAHFKVAGLNTSVTIRFLGIDTPESTITIQPWGKLASKTMCGFLTSAKSIVLEGVLGADGTPELDSTNKRYTGFVWVNPIDTASTNYYNANLRMVEESLSYNRGTSTKYRDAFALAEANAMKLARRVFSSSQEKDPNYNYSGEYSDKTVKELKDDIGVDSLVATNMRVTGYVSRKQGSNLYLTDNVDSGIYVFIGFKNIDFISIGDLIQVMGTWEKSDTYGYQLTNVDFMKLEINGVLGSGNEIVSKIVTVPETDDIENIGMLITIKDLEVTYIPKMEKDSTGMWLGYSVRAEDSSGNEIVLRIDASLNPSHSAVFEPSEFGVVGSILDITGVMVQFHDNYQLMVTETTDIVIH